MLTGDLFALRPGAPDEGPADAIEPVLGAAPVRVEPEPSRAQVRTRRLRLAAAWLVAGLVHAGLAVAFLYIWHAMVRDLTAPEPIAVEVVHEVPGETPPKPPEPKTPEPKPPEPKPPEPKPPEPEPPKPEPPKPEPPKPDTKADTSPPPTPPQNALQEALAAGVAEPPAESRAAATQNQVNQKGNSVAGKGSPEPAAAGVPDAPAETPPAPPPAAPTVLTAPQADTSVPAPAPEPPAETPAAPGQGDPSQSAKATAQLAAALPYSTGLPIPSTFRSALSALGTSATANYRGSIFGALSRVREEMDERARAAKLEGQVVVGISLNDDGTLANVKVVQSSGHADADAFALAMVRQAAPFPPPPPGVPHTFTPVITFGDS